MKIKFYFILILVLVCYNVQAQQLLTKEEAVKLALENNYGIKLANANVEIAQNNAGILNSGYLPSVTAGAGANYDKNNIEAETSNGPINSDGVESTRYNASVSLNYMLFDGLGRAYNYKQLKETQQLTELQARETIENTILQLFTVYYSVAEQVENTHAISQTLAISKDRLNRAQYQFEYGQDTKLAVLNAEVDINNDSINLMNSEQRLINFKRDLNLVLGNSLIDDFNIETQLNFNILYNKEELFKKAQAENISLLQIDKSIAINKLGLKTQKSAFLPTIGLTGSYGWNKNNNPANFTTVFISKGISGGVNLSWSLFDGGSTITRVKNAQINLDANTLQKEQLQLALERDFNNAWDDFQNKLSIFYLQEENIKTAQNNFDRTEEKFKLGQVNSIEFRQAQLNLLNAELSRNQAKYQAKLSELLLLQISGELLNIEF